TVRSRFTCRPPAAKSLLCPKPREKAPFSRHGHHLANHSCCLPPACSCVIVHRRNPAKMLRSDGTRRRLQRVLPREARGDPSNFELEINGEELVHMKRLSLLAATAVLFLVAGPALAAEDF